MTIDLYIVASVAAGIVSTIATLRWLEWWLAKPTFRELSRYSDDNLSDYANRRDALAEADPDFLTEYARRVQSWEQVKAGES